MSMSTPFCLLGAAFIRRPLLVVCLAAMLPVSAAAQKPDLAPWDPGLEPPLLPTVIFTYDFPGVDPDHYALAVNSVGSAAYESRGVAPISGEPREPYMLKFTFSAENLERVFILLRKLDYFDGDFDLKRGRVARMGIKTLIYQDGARRVQTSFNWSENPHARELASLLQSVSATMEFGRKLRHLRRFDKLGLDAELRQMEKFAKAGRLAEGHVLIPILREIAADAAVMRMARDRAQRLLLFLEPAEAAGRDGY